MLPRSKCSDQVTKELEATSESNSTCPTDANASNNSGIQDYEKAKYLNKAEVLRHSMIPSTLATISESEEEKDQSNINLKIQPAVHPVTNNGQTSEEKENISSFKRGILCSSTPLRKVNPLLKLDNKYSLAISENDNTGKTECMDNTKEYQTTNTKLLEETMYNLCKEVDDNCDKTVFHKDELSLAIDMPSLKTNPNDKPSGIEHNNLIVSVGGNHSVIYKNQEERYIDDILVKNGQALKNIQDIYNLDSEPDKNKIIKKAENLQIFISNDEDENKDNDDSDWELFKKIETDVERYKAVRKMWKNLKVPDPKQNLSYFNWRRRNSLKPLQQIKPSKEQQPQISNTYHCTEVFDGAIEKLHALYFISDIGDQEPLHSNPKYRKYSEKPLRPHNLNSHQMKEFILERLNRIKAAKEEIEAVNKFYSGLQSDSHDHMILNHKKRREIMDIEETIISYSDWYNN